MSETGHPINIANFKKLLAAIGSFGSRYAPSNPKLATGSLDVILDNVETTSSILKDAISAQSTASNTRDALFEPLDTLTRRIQSSAKSADATPAQLADMEEAARKIKGDRAGIKNPAPVNPGDPKSISVSQQSYANLADHLDSLLATLQAIPAYAPNEADLTLGALQTLHKDMVTANDAVVGADIGLSTARTNRNTAMYGADSGLVDVAAKVKDYVFSSAKLGAKNPDYIAVKGIEFTRLKK